MASKKLGLIVLLAFGIILMNKIEIMEAQEEDKVCPLICYEAKYMTCLKMGDKHLEPVCNCCLAPKGCTLHLQNGQNLYC
ncbi:hypothetical protein RND81_01G212000 [Saponaria officinalis]|uniref:Uncharacterized protein n=1 Tax=Saponaria officinalis TaxID=3572 RepID=A0AAW1NBG5_SAPOF